MRVFVKTLKGSSFEIQVEPQHTIADVKKNIESAQGQTVYPAEQQLLIHQGKILKDDTTLQDNQVAEDSFLVIMLSKSKSSSSGASTAKAATSSQVSPATATTPPPAPAQTPETSPAATPASAPDPAVTAAPAPVVIAPIEANTYGQAASNLVAGNNFEQAVQGILDMGGGTWDRDTVVRALRAAFNNPERAVEYLYSGIPENADAPAPPVAREPSGGNVPPVPQAPSQPVPPVIPPSGPNANPLDLFPQGLPAVGSNAGVGNLDFLRNSPQFRALQAMVQANPQILQPMLQELGRQNPQIMRLIQEHQADFLRLLNEPVEGAEGGLPEGAMPQAVTVTPEEHEAIERLEAMGFDRALVLEVFFACNKNEELAANYLLDHMHEFEE